MGNLGNKGVLEKVEYSEWASTIVPVVKSDGSVRLCGDYKVTCNPHLEVDQYPLPKHDDFIFKFTTLDLSHAYNQVELEPTSRNIVTINTHKSLSSHPFGVWSVPSKCHVLKHYGSNPPRS